MPLFFLGTREWRNRQTRTVQVRVPVMEWGFNSPLAHDETADPLRICGFCFPWLWLVAPLVFRAPEGPAAVCAGGRRPARESSALRASLGASPRSPARPRRRPPAPRQIPPVPSTPVGPGVLRSGLARCLEARPVPAPRRVPYPQFRMQFPNTCSSSLSEKPGISTITFQSMKCTRGNCMRICADRVPLPPTGTVAGPSGALHTGGAWCADVWLGACCYKRRQSKVFFVWISAPLLQTSSIHRLFR